MQMTKHTRIVQTDGSRVTIFHLTMVINTFCFFLHTSDLIVDKQDLKDSKTYQVFNLFVENVKEVDAVPKYVTVHRKTRSALW